MFVSVNGGPATRAAAAKAVHRANNFDFVRFVAASLVLFSHSYSLTGMGGDEPLVRQTGGQFTFGGLAVRVFFVISGYLVCQSWLRRPHVVPFVVARSLRIFPGFAVALLLSVLLGLAVGRLAPLEYLRHPDTWHYVWNNLTMHTEFFLPGVFEGNVYPRAVNGSIWSLRFEVRAYIVVLALGVLTLLRPGIVGVAGWALAASCIWLAPSVWGIVGTADMPITQLFVCFSTAAVIALNPRMIRYCGWLTLAFVALLATVAKGAAVEYCVSGLLCTGILWFVHRPLPLIRDWARHGDFSYGIFIYAFPLQQLIAFTLRPDGNPYTMMLWAFPATLAVSILSWRLVEGPCLALKGRVASALQAPLEGMQARLEKILRRGSAEAPGGELPERPDAKTPG